jgi:hypothetical protein
VAMAITWTVSNICANVKYDEAKLEQILKIILYHQKSTKEKILANVIRAVGSILKDCPCPMLTSVLGKMKAPLSALFDFIVKNITSNNPKTAWTASAAISNATLNSTLDFKGIANTVFSSLCKIVSTHHNFKVKINAIKALRAIHQYNPLQNAVLIKSYCLSYSNLNISTIYTNAKYIETIEELLIESLYSCFKYCGHPYSQDLIDSVSDSYHVIYQICKSTIQKRLHISHSFDVNQGIEVLGKWDSTKIDIFENIQKLAGKLTEIIEKGNVKVSFGMMDDLMQLSKTSISDVSKLPMIKEYTAQKMKNI